MDHVLGWVSSGASGPLVFAIDATIRATVLLALAFVAHAALGRSRALVRSALWNACLVGLLLIPASILALPRLIVPAPPLPAASVLVFEAPAAPLVDPSWIEERPPFSPPFGPIEGPAAISAFASPPPEVVVDRPAPWRIDPTTLALGVYLAASVLLAARLAASLATVHRLKRRCKPVEVGEWVEALERWRKALGIRRSVGLQATDEVSVPVVVGWLRPAIILPRRLVGTVGRPVVDAILLHELAHVRRGDFGWNLVRKLVQVLYWPHPMAWPLGRVIGAVREQACDDLCIHALGAASGYRASLLEVASGLVRRPDPALGLAMARTSNLARRIAWIDRSRGASRCLMRTPSRLALAAVVLAVAGAIGSVELARARVAEEPKPASPKPAESEPVQPPAVEIVVKARDTGKPLAGASARVVIDWDYVVMKTDQDGRLVVDLSKRVFQETLDVDVWADGYVQQRFRFAQNEAKTPKIPTRLDVALFPGEETLGGTVKNEDGQPIAGAKVEVWGYLGEKKAPNELAFKVAVDTDAQGRWRLRSTRGLKFAQLYLSHPDYLPGDGMATRRHGRPDSTDSAKPGEGTMAALRDFSDVQIMKRGVDVSGTVVDAQGAPVAGAEVGWLGMGDEQTFHFDLPTTTSDADGRFHFHLPTGRVMIQAKARGHGPELAPFNVGPDMGPVVVKLPKPVTFAGRVEDSSGNPIARAYIYASDWRGFRALGANFVTDADGRFRWDDAPNEPIQITVVRAGYSDIFHMTVTPGLGELHLMLRRALYVRGKIVDAETKAPVGQARIQLGSLDPESGAFTWSPAEFGSSDDGTFNTHFDAEKATEHRLRFKAAGYEPFESITYRNGDDLDEQIIKMTRSKVEKIATSGVVRGPDGTPLAGAEVAVAHGGVIQGGANLGNAYAPTSVTIRNGAMSPGRHWKPVKTDAEGRFTLLLDPESAEHPSWIFVAHPEFFAKVPLAALKAESTITTRPWGRVEGVARIGSKPAAGKHVWCYISPLIHAEEPGFTAHDLTTADADGRFVFPRVAPGEARVGRFVGDQVRGPAPEGELVEVRSGETTRVEVGGKGRPVIARIALPEGFEPRADVVTYSEFSIRSDRPRIPYPKEVLAKRDESMDKWLRQWWNSPEGRAYRRDWYYIDLAKLQPDGTIRVEDVPPGEYVLKLTASLDPVRAPFASQPGRTAYATRKFTIPEIPGGRTDEPFDLGELHPEPKRTLGIGQPAPAFDVETLGDGRIKLEDFRGKYVLLDFWATWCGPCVAEVPALKALHDRFGKDPRFAMISLSLDADKDAPRTFVAEKGLNWSQGFLGDWPEGGAHEAYHVEAIPATFLIAPDGTMKAQGLRGPSIEAAVAQALKSP